MTPTQKATCSCGAPEIETTGEPVTTGYCHCQSCHHHSGAPLGTFFLFGEDAVRVVRGAELIGRFNDSGMSDRQHCTHCAVT